MKATVIEFVAKTKNGYKSCNGVKRLVMSFKDGNAVTDINVIDFLNKEFPTTADKNSENTMMEFFTPSAPVIWEFDDKAGNTYFSRYADDGTITGDAYKIIGIKEW